MVLHWIVVTVLAHEAKSSSFFLLSADKMIITVIEAMHCLLSDSNAYKTKDAPPLIRTWQCIVQAFDPLICARCANRHIRPTTYHNKSLGKQICPSMRFLLTFVTFSSYQSRTISIIFDFSNSCFSCSKGSFFYCFYFFFFCS